MSALNSEEAQRLALFMERLKAPLRNEPHEGMARAMLGSQHRWQRGDRDFLRRMVCQPVATSADWTRLMALLRNARERAW